MSLLTSASNGLTCLPRVRDQSLNVLIVSKGGITQRDMLEVVKQRPGRRLRWGRRPLGRRSGTLANGFASDQSCYEQHERRDL